MNASSRLLLMTLCAFSGYRCSAQEANPYIENGSAKQLNCNCYSLTPDELYQAGSVWNKNKISLTKSFDYKFNVFLGCKDLEGADGIAFILQTAGTSLGGNGQGLGFENVKPSIGIPIDTYQNPEFKDPDYDHIGIYKNGDLVNGTSNTLAGPVQALANSPNIEDCKWHTFRITWDATGKVLAAYVDDSLRVRAVVDLVKTVFGNSGDVYWGFSAATGGNSNVQQFCTSLNPDFGLAANQKSCAPASLLLKDSSLSFGSIVKWNWNFGDGSTFQGQNPPAHSYPKPGKYTVKLNIVGNDGCQSTDFTQTLTVSSIPIAYYKDPSPVCAFDTITLKDSSQVQFGTFSEWDWTLNNASTPVKRTTGNYPVSFGLGQQQMTLLVKTIEGCVSQPFTRVFETSEKPDPGFSANDPVCYGDPVHFAAVNHNAGSVVRQWYWSYGDGRFDSTASVSHNYLRGGEYNAILQAVNMEGCVSDKFSKTVIVYQTHANAGNDTVVAIGQPVQLHATGGVLYEWSPATYLSDPASDHPIATLQGDFSYVLKAYTPIGCATYDTILIKAYRGPDLYVPNAFTPNNDGRNDRFRAVTPGMAVIRYFRIYNRNGQLIYDSPNTQEGWDGTWKGQPQPTGGYVWMIGGIDYLGQSHTAKGAMVLIR